MKRVVLELMICRMARSHCSSVFFCADKSFLVRMTLTPLKNASSSRAAWQNWRTGCTQYADNSTPIRVAMISGVDTSV